MVQVAVGQIVIWKSDPCDPGTPAVVTRVYATSIDCSCFLRDGRYVIPHSGVRHVSDPLWPTLTPDAQYEGLFDITERDRLIDGMLRQAYKK